jgi:hypothetical protein
VKDTTAILYPPGCYGTYVDWILRVLTTDLNVESPFNDDGASHQIKESNWIKGISYWDDYVQSSNNYPFVRMHPKISNKESVSTSIEKILKDTKNLILLEPTETTILLAINNQFSKACENWWAYQFSNSFDVNVLKNNWPLDNTSTDYNSFPIWVKREFLSFYFMPMWFDQVEYGVERPIDDRVLIVYIDDLLYNFEQTVKKMILHIGRKQTKDIATIKLLHQYNVSLQQFTNQDYICNEIIKSVIENINFSWKPITLLSESYIQWKLREMGFEIMCNELNTFPTNSLQLKELLYEPV